MISVSSSSSETLRSGILNYAISSLESGERKVTLGRALAVGLILYAVILFEDLYDRGAMAYLRHFGMRPACFWLR